MGLGAAAGFAVAGAFTEGEGEGDGVGITVGVGVGDHVGAGNGVVEALGVCAGAEPQAQRAQETAKQRQTKQISA